jgi:hypothetical protein
MADKIPLKAIYTGSDATALGEFETGDTIPVAFLGGTPSHTHTGVYEPADATILKDADIGSTVQAYDADTAKLDTAQTWTAKQTFGGTAETWTALSGTTPSITAGSHTWTLTGASTPADGLSDGDHCTLMIDDGSAATINWSSVVDQWDGGSAPTLPADGYLHVVLWKVGTTVYGSFGQGMAAP